jgi:hypothetical protein
LCGYPSPVSSPLRVADPPSPTRGEGKKEIARNAQLYCTLQLDTPISIRVSSSGAITMASWPVAMSA